MACALASLDRRFLAPAPPTRLATLRVLVGAFSTIYLAVRATFLLDWAALPDGRFAPAGILRLLDSPPPVWLVKVAIIVGVALGVAFTLGWRYRVTGPAFSVAMLLLMTYDNSWQLIAHTQNLFVLHALVLGFSPAAAAWSLDARRRSLPTAGDAPEFGWPVRLITLITVLTYALAGWAKVRHGGIDWVTGDVLRNQIAHDNLRKIALGDVHSPIGARLVRYGWLFPPLAFVSLFVELGAPIALLRGRPRHVWVASAWLFHVGVLALMAILFIYPLTGIAYASMLAPERAVGWLRTRRAVTIGPLRARRSRPTVG
jgi:hypothetical protein